METAIWDRIRQTSEHWGLALDPKMREQLGLYLDLLRRWNQKINLTAIDDPRQIAELHFLDSLAPVPLLRDSQDLIDVGSGGGFPGAVLAVALPALQVTCIDAVAKKIAFVQTVKRTLGLGNLKALHARDEQIGERFGAAISRATWDPPVWVEHGARLVREGGLVVAMQTGEAPMIAETDGLERLPAYEYEIGGIRRKLQPFRRR